MSSIARLLKHPPRLWVPLVLHRAGTTLRRRFELLWDDFLPSFSRKDSLTLSYRLAAPNPDMIVSCCPWLGEVTDLFMGHKFDWLGLGWQSVGYGSIPTGMGGHRYETDKIRPVAGGDWLDCVVSRPNRPEARRIWRMLEGQYEPIDWQRDHRSGYRWDGSARSSTLPIYPCPGADIKQPWELARLQHLPLVALAYRCSAAGMVGFRESGQYRNEFRNMILDFVATNPPRHGVNWICAMDVGIRVANMVVAWDLFRAAGARFDKPFEDLLARSVFEHGRHIRAHLERRPDFRANHYLANLAGLLFSAAYLGAEDACRRWWEFSRRELAREVERQFFPDGSNFESSVGYHRLSGEMAVWAIALILGVDGEGCLAQGVKDRLAGIGNYVRASARPDGSAVPIGDLDSGRFMKISSVFVPMSKAEAVATYDGLDNFVDRIPERWWDEQLNRHGHLSDACDALLGSREAMNCPETFMLRTLCGGRTLTGSAQRAPKTMYGGDWETLLAGVRNNARHPARRYSIPLDLGRHPELHAYEKFGLYIVRDGNRMITVRCGPNGQEGNGGHAHNDQLSLTCFKDGVAIIEDPGTAIYHALPSQRNAYRSVSAHFAPRPARGEPASLDVDPFRLPAGGEGVCHWFGPEGFIGSHRGFGYAVTRVVVWIEGHLAVEDYSEGDCLVDLGLDGGGGRWQPPVRVASKYGRPLK
jgi:hypothetical protein